MGQLENGPRLNSGGNAIRTASKGQDFRPSPVGRLIFFVIEEFTADFDHRGEVLGSDDLGLQTGNQRSLKGVDWLKFLQRLEIEQPDVEGDGLGSAQSSAGVDPP
jgi:hypothetical protein